MNRQENLLLNIELSQEILFNGFLVMKAICPIPIGLFFFNIHRRLLILEDR